MVEGTSVDWSRGTCVTTKSLCIITKRQNASESQIQACMLFRHPKYMSIFPFSFVAMQLEVIDCPSTQMINLVDALRIL